MKSVNPSEEEFIAEEPLPWALGCALQTARLGYFETGKQAAQAVSGGESKLEISGWRTDQQGSFWEVPRQVQGNAMTDPKATPQRHKQAQEAGWATLSP